MRKLPLLVAGVLALALGVAGIAQAVNSKQGMKVSLSKNSVKKAKKGGVGTFTVALSLDGGQRSAVRDVHDRRALRQEPRLQLQEVPDLHVVQAASRRGAVQEGEGRHGHGHRPGEHRCRPESLTIKPTTARAASSTCT